MPARLSPTQLAVLRAAAEGRVWRASSGEAINVWFASDGRGSVTGTVKALIRRGLLMIDPASPRHRRTVRLTDAGRALLDTLNGKDA